MRHPSKKLSNLSVGIGLDDKMPMIGHDAVGVNWKRNSLNREF